MKREIWNEMKNSCVEHTCDEYETKAYHLAS